MKLGLTTGYWAGGPPAGIDEVVHEAETLGFHSVWTAEAYGSDALTPLAWWGARTQRLKLGTGVMQMSARTPAATAMAAMTMDHLSDGRFILGLGVSGPQVVEGWYGQPFAKPLARTREYVQIVRDIVRREGPVTFDGDHYVLPYKDENATGLGKPLKSSIHPLNKDLPIYLGAEGPKNIAQTAEIADGWLALFFSPHHQDFYVEHLNEGFSRPNARHTKETFEICCSVPVVIHDDVETAADVVRPMYALYFGGMGARSKNFHADVPSRMGFADEVRRIQELYLDGKKREAAAAVPTGLVEQLALIGPEDKVRHDLEAWKESIVDVLLVSGDPPLLNKIAELAG